MRTRGNRDTVVFPQLGLQRNEKAIDKSYNSSFIKNEMPDLKSKNRKNTKLAMVRFPGCKNALNYVCGGDLPQTPQEELTALPQTLLAGLKGPTSNGTGGRGLLLRRREGKRGEAFPQTKIYHYTAGYSLLKVGAYESIDLCAWSR